MYESVYQQAKPYFSRNTLSYLILSLKQNATNAQLNAFKMKKSFKTPT